MADVRLSEMTMADALSSATLTMVAQADSSAATGYASKKTTLGAVGDVLANTLEYDELTTTAQTLVGALNEVNEVAEQIAVFNYNDRPTLDEIRAAAGKAVFLRSGSMILPLMHATSSICEFEGVLSEGRAAVTLYRYVVDSDDEWTLVTRGWGLPLFMEKTSVSIGTSSWSLEATPTYTDYPYAATVTFSQGHNSLAGYDVAEVIPSLEMIDAGLVCPLCACTDGVVTLYASEPCSITIPRITVRGEAG